MCPRGHRVIPSTGDHYTVAQDGEGYRYVLGRCEDLPAVEHLSAGGDDGTSRG